MASSRLWMAAALALVSTTIAWLAVCPHVASNLRAASSTRPSAKAPDPRVAALLDSVDEDLAMSELAQLAGDEPMCLASGCETIVNRRTGSNGCRRTVDFLAERSADLGYEVETADWRAGDEADRNVLAVKTGVISPTERVVFVAHADGVDSCPASRCPAADDNASGTVGGLVLARALAGVAVARTVVIFFSTGEEEGMLGVRAYINDLPAAGLAEIKYLVNADMIGYDGNGDRLVELYWGAHEPSHRLAEALKRSIDAYGLGLDTRLNSGCG